MLRRCIRMFMLTAFLCVVGEFVQAQGAKSSINIQPQEKWQTVFGREECVYHFQIISTEPFQGRLGWSLRCGNRTIARGERAFETGPGKGGLIRVPLKIPPVKEGVMMPTQFSVTLYRKGEKKTLALWEETLHIFSRDPFALKKEWLKGLNIGLFDPEKKTSEAFKDLEIPFDLQNNIDALSEFDGSLFIAGSGLDFTEYRGLWDAVLQLCARKIPVLILAPSGGAVTIPGVEGAILPEPAGMRLLRKGIIHKLHKKLDADAWPPDGKVVVSSMMLKTTRAGLMGEFVAGDEGWPWFEADFTGKGGKLVVCGFGIVERMNAGPTPRFLLARLFEYLAGNGNLTKKGEAR